MKLVCLRGPEAKIEQVPLGPLRYQLFVNVFPFLVIFFHFLIVRHRRSRHLSPKTVRRLVRYRHHTYREQSS